MFPDAWANLLEFSKEKGVDPSQTDGERWFFAIGTSIVEIAVFWGLNAILGLIYHYDLFSAYKIQKGKFPDRELVRDCLQKVGFSFLLLCPVSYFVQPGFKRFGSSLRTEDLPSAGTVVWQILVAALLNETMFYWFHRLLHTPALYGRIHKQHHNFKVTIGIAAPYANFVEEVFANFLPSVLPPMVLGMHYATWWLWMSLRLWETVDAHSGYSFPFSPFTFLCNDSARRHDYHHSHNIGNFGSCVYLWDWLCETDKSYKAWNKKRLEQEAGFDTSKGAKGKANSKQAKAQAATKPAQAQAAKAPTPLPKAQVAPVVSKSAKKKQHRKAH